jgi:hypothetical protein
VNITWDGVGGQYKGTESGRYPDEYGTYRYRYSFAGRDAVIAPGRIGNHVSVPATVVSPVVARRRRQRALQPRLPRAS